MSTPLLAWPPGSHDAARCFSRPYACEAADLDVTLEGSDRIPEAVTTLLSMCLRDAQGVAPATESAWAWSVPRRRQGLVAIAYATLGGTVKALSRCPASGCRNQIEMDIGLASLASETQDHVELEVDGRRIECRLANGKDLLEWARDRNFDPAWLAARLVMTIDGEPKCSDWESPAHWLDRFDAAFAEADPLATLAVPVHCPCCGFELDVTLDVEPLLLGALRAVARETLDDVHRLARAYHWSESEIVAMPRERRRAYLQRLQREVA